MICEYILKYKGNEIRFTNETALNDFLSSKYRYKDKLGDIIFSTDIPMSKLESLASYGNKGLELMAAKRVIADRKSSYDGPYNPYLDNDVAFAAPFIGVTTAISKMRQFDNPQRRLVPEFIQENLFNEIYDAILNGNKDNKFNEDDLAAVMNGMTVDEFKLKRKDEAIDIIDKTLTKKWKFQGELGNAIHDVMQCYFSGVFKFNDGKKLTIRNINKRDLRKSAFMQLVRDGFSTESFSYGSNVLMNGQTVSPVSAKYVNDDMLNALFNYAEALHNNLKMTFGDDAIFLTEFPVYDDTDVDIVKNESTGETTKAKMMGSIDLLIIDKNGKPHIVDYKTTTKSYEQMSSFGVTNAKVRTYTYQQGFYRRMLNRNTGLDTNGSQCMIAGIHLGEMKYDEAKGEWRCDRIISGTDDAQAHDISGYFTEANGETIMLNINDTLPEKPVEKINMNSFHSDIEKEQAAILPEYGYEYREMSNETAKRIFDERVYYDRSNNRYKLCTDSRKKYVQLSNGQEISSSSPEGMIKAIKDYYMNKPMLRQDKVATVRTKMIQVLSNGRLELNIFDENGIYRSKNHALNNKMREYTDGNWRVMEGDVADEIANYGIILVENIKNGQVDVINLTNIDLLQIHRFSGKPDQSLLTSAFGLDDIREKAKSNTDRRMLESFEGNIEIMKTMSVLYAAKELFSDERRYIGNIRVINYEKGEEIPARNNDIMYSYQRLRKLGGLERASGLKMADTIKLIQLKLLNLQTIFDMDENDVFNRFKELNRKGRFLTKNRRFSGDDGYNSKSYYSLIENSNTSELADILTDLAEQIENQYEVVKQSLENKSKLIIDESTSASDRQVLELYINITDAIAELKGVPFPQQLESTKKWMQYSFSELTSKGAAGTEYDNPGMMQSEILNSFSRVLKTAYQNTQDEMTNPLARMRELEERMIKLAYDSKIAYTFKSKEDMWDRFYEKDVNGNISEKMRFKHLDDESLSPEERDILDKLLVELNRYRYSNGKGTLMTDDEVRAKRFDEDYYNIPLLKKKKNEVNSDVSDEGEKKLNRANRFLNGLKDFFFGEAGEHTMHTEFEERATEIFGENDIFRKELNGEARERYIEKNGVGTFNLNATNAVLNFILNDRLRKNTDNAIMIAKCIIIHLKANASKINRTGKGESFMFENDIQWLMDYIRGRIRGEDINPTEFKKLTSITNQLSNLAVKATLGFSVNQLTYQSLQGLFTNASLCMRKVLGKDSFDKDDFSRAISIVYPDVFDMNTHNLLGQMNTLYGINDMDMRGYVENANNRTDLSTWRGFWRTGTKFSSRPDFYNRMTIFVAQMIHDGVYDAYSIKDGIIHYDFKKDKRFSKLSDPNAVKDDEYYRQLGLYRAIAKQLALEGAIIPANQSKSGRQEVFTFSDNDNPIDNQLPKPYTSQQSESIKNVGDDTYGYYSQEKKALIHLKWAGNLFMQFKTYFSGKKNQYFIPGGVKLRGYYTHGKDDDGNYLYEVVVNENGEDIVYTMSKDKDGKLYLDGNEFTGEYKMINPLIVWKGMYQEGIALTLHKLIKNGILQDISAGDWKFSTFKKVISEYTNNEDDSIKACFRNNMVQLRNDALIFLLIGVIASLMLKKLSQDVSDDDELSGAAKDATALLAQSVSSAALDFNAPNSLLGVLTNWTPMSISWGSKLVENTVDMITGDKTPISWGASSFTAARQIKSTVKDIFDSDN